MGGWVDVGGGLAIKTEIKSEIKQEQEHRNTRHRYKNRPLTGNVNYIHPDGTPCRSLMRTEAELPDLPNIDSQERQPPNGLHVETETSTHPTITVIADMSVENNNTGLRENVPGYSNPSDTDHILTNAKEPNTLPAPEVTITKKQSDVPVETVTTSSLENITDKQNEDLPVETDVDVDANADRASGGADGSPRELMDIEPRNNTISEWNTELSMSGSEDDTDLTEKYDNSKVLPVDAARQVDYGLDQNSDVPTQSKNEKTLPQSSTSRSKNEILTGKKDNDKLLPENIARRVDCGLSRITDAPTPPESKKTLLDTNRNTEDDTNLSYDSDDTILLEQEIAEAIGDQASDQVNKELPGETGATGDTTTIMNQFANVRINNDLPVETANTPISPNKGKVVIRSYRLCRRATNENEGAETIRTDEENTENEALHLNVPTGNATRPPPPNKYKIRKFQIDKVRYYSCTYCNKHFESIQYLNNHHRKRHPPVTCDVCGKLYDTPNSLIRHSYRHLDGQHKCKDCEQSFHFKSELTSHSMKHAMERLHCKQCDRNFIRHSDLNAHIDTHGEKWKCTFPGCSKECADKRYLNTHMKVHSEELKYQCRKCKKRFRFYEQRKRHEADHS